MYKWTYVLKTCVVQGSVVHIGYHFNQKTKEKFGESTFPGVRELGGHEFCVGVMWKQYGPSVQFSAGLV